MCAMKLLMSLWSHLWWGWWIGFDWSFCHFLFFLNGLHNLTIPNIAFIFGRFLAGLLLSLRSASPILIFLTRSGALVSNHATNLFRHHTLITITLCSLKKSWCSCVPTFLTWCSCADQQDISFCIFFFERFFVAIKVKLCFFVLVLSLEGEVCGYVCIVVLCCVWLFLVVLFLCLCWIGSYTLYMPKCVV